MHNRLTPLAKQLRRNSTTAETLLWRKLRNRQMNGHKFRRQQPLGPYIADFVCHELRLIIELDGGQHANTLDRDQTRDAYLRTLGYKILRFWNNEVLENLEGVLMSIAKFAPPPPPPARGGATLQSRPR